MRAVCCALATVLVALTIATVAAQQPQTPQPQGPGGRGGVVGGVGRRQFPPRDIAPAPIGTARIRGRITAADSGGALRRAQVQLTSQDTRSPKTAITDAEGRYEFADLPAGRYTLTARKTGYLTLQYGQRRPLEPGKPIDVSAGQVLEKTDMTLPRGGVIAGRILDEYGEPLPDATVQAMRYQYVGGQRQLVPAGRAAQTDDIGQFRIFGLPPADYYISATTRTPMAAIQSAAAAVMVAPPAGGVAVDAPAVGLQALRDAFSAPDDGQTGYAPTFYPGTATLSDAQRVTIAVGEELPGIGFAMTVAKLARISGTVVDSQGQPLTRGNVMIRPSRGAPTFMRGMNGGAVNSGTFRLVGVPPGDYVIQVRNAGFGRGGGGGEVEFANFPLSVNGSDVDGLVITMSKGATVSGRITLASGRTPATGSSIQVSAVATDAVPAGFGPGGASSRVDSAGAFMLRGITGPSLLRATNLPSGWTLKAVRLDGADITDTPHEFNSGETGVEIELSDKPTRITGTVTDNQKQPIRDYAVVVFSDDSAHWVAQTRFVRAARPDQEGKFQITGLPPGRYLAVALDYLEQGSETDPTLLEQLKTKGTGVTLNEGETQQLDLKLSL